MEGEENLKIFQPLCHASVYVVLLTVEQDEPDDRQVDDNVAANCQITSAHHDLQIAKWFYKYKFVHRALWYITYNISSGQHDGKRKAADYKAHCEKYGSVETGIASTRHRVVLRPLSHKRWNHG